MLPYDLGNLSSLHTLSIGAKPSLVVPTMEVLIQGCRCVGVCEGVWVCVCLFVFFCFCSFLCFPHHTLNPLLFT